MIGFGLSLAQILGQMVIVAGIVVAAFQMVQLSVAIVTLLVRPPPSDPRDNWNRFSKLAPSVSIIVPAYNEQATIATSVSALLAVEYSDFEVIVVNDGSHDDTLLSLIFAFELEPATLPEAGLLNHQPYKAAYRARAFPRLFVVDKHNGGKADALNAGANIASGEFICVIDADSILDRDALLRAARSIIDNPGQVVAVGGAIRLTNGCEINGSDIVRVAPPRTLLPLFQTVEYLRTFNTARTAMSAMGSLSLISGAFGLFSKQVLYAVGGYAHGTVGEDYELCMRFHRYIRAAKLKDNRILYVPDAVCWTQAPDDLATLGRQRARWQRGALETLWKHRGVIGNPHFGRLAYVSSVEAVLCDVVSPITEFFGYLLIPVAVLFGILSIDYLIAFLGLSIGFGLFQSAGAIALEELRFRRFPKAWHGLLLLGAALLENFGYRQICGWWRMRGCVEYFQGKQSWGAMVRKPLATRKP